MAAPDPSPDFPTLDEALTRYAHLLTRLTEAMFNLGETRAAEERQRVTAWFAARAQDGRDSTTYRNMAALYSTFDIALSSPQGDLSSERYRLQADVDSMQAEIAFLRTVIDVHTARLVRT